MQELGGYVAGRLDEDCASDRHISDYAAFSTILAVQLYDRSHLPRAFGSSSLVETNENTENELTVRGSSCSLEHAQKRGILLLFKFFIYFSE